MRLLDVGEPKFELHAPDREGVLDGTLVVLWHGAGGDIDEPSLVRSAERLALAGANVARARFSYRREGRRAPDRMPKLLEDQRETIAEVRRVCPPLGRLVLGGRSMGGRAASMLIAEGYAADALVLLSYPLHPAGEPEKLRAAHLASIPCPILFVQGDRDALCRMDLLTPVLAELGSRARLVCFHGADHGMRKVRPESIADAVVEFARQVVSE